MKARFSFGIISSREFYNKLIEEYNEFDSNYISARHAINCSITSWHLTDWTYNEFFKADPDYQTKEKTKEKNGKVYVKVIPGVLIYQNELVKKCPELKYMRLIANGSKHCLLRNTEIKEKTVIYKGDYNNDYSRHDYDVDRFQIDTDGGKIDFEKTLMKTIEFWNDYLDKLEK